MTGPLPAGLRATVRVSATSANLGPGYDALGLALDLLDEVEVETRGSGCSVQVLGEGAAGVPRDETHLVVRALRAGLDHVGVPQPGLMLRATNRIPHGRGLGSSAAATIAGLLLARGLASAEESDSVGGALTDEVVLRLATAMEGHPDNVAACLLGGASIAWTETGTSPVAAGVRAVRIGVDGRIRPQVLVPDATLATTHARSLLPDHVAHADAAWTVARAALLVEALGRRPDLLLEATADRLHQPHRQPAMPGTMALVDQLRRHGIAAAVSGAGPSVLVLGSTDVDVAGVLPAGALRGWRALPLAVRRDGASVRVAGRVPAS